jgi:hypothetical protein
MRVSGGFHLFKRSHIAFVLFLAAGSASCAVVDSSLIEEGSYGRCESEAGFYYLPKTQLRVEVRTSSVGDKTADYLNADAPKDLENGTFHEIFVSRLRVPDKTRGYCLDYLRRMTSDDKLTVKKYKAAPLLGLVSSDATDRSLEIAEMLIQTVFVAASGNPSFSRTSATRSFIRSINGVTQIIAFKGDYDPFDPLQSAGINQALRNYGYCLLLEKYTFDLNKASIDDYCDSPIATNRRAGQRKFEYAFGQAALRKFGERAAQHDPTVSISGLFYRPRIPYQLFIFSKRNLQARGGWKLTASHPVPIENIAPILSIGVDRTMFAERKTSLVFEEGMLREACQFKGSELEAAAKIPLFVAESVVALPANILQVRIDQTSGMNKLIAAQDNAIQVQTKYLAELDKLSDASVSQLTSNYSAQSYSAPIVPQFDPNHPFVPPDTTRRTAASDDYFNLTDGNGSPCKPRPTGTGTNTATVLDANDSPAQGVQEGQ